MRLTPFTLFVIGAGFEPAYGALSNLNARDPFNGTTLFMGSLASTSSATRSFFNKASLHSLLGGFNEYNCNEVFYNTGSNFTAVISSFGFIT